MEGFFTAKETTSETRPDGKVYSCISCGRLKDAENPKLKVSGKGEKGILNIFSDPAQLEDRSGKPFTSKTARFLKKKLEQFGVSLENDCYNTYAAKCGGGGPPSAYQLDCCRKFLLKVIKELKPKVIIVHGDNPLYSLIGNRWKKDFGKIQKWRGWKIPDQDLGTWVCPTYSTEFIINAETAVEEVIWGKDIEEAIKVAKKPFETFVEPEIIYLKRDLTVLDTITDCDIAFDYETTGLKPHGEEHEIICAAVAVSSSLVYTFPIPKSKKRRKPFIDLIERKGVGKIAQNMKYEDHWTNEILKTPVTNWVWDTMQATHILDNRKGITSLKFQTYTQFGIVDYDSDVNPYITTLREGEVKKCANSINKVHELIAQEGGMEKLLKYCAYDSIFEYRLAEYQRPIFKASKGLTAAYKLMHDGILALAKAERQGLRIDTVYIEKKKRGLTRQITKIENEFFNSKFYRHWEHSLGRKPNLNSGDQLADFIYNTKKIPPLKFTDSGKGSTDEEALQLLKIPELDLVLKRSKLKKLRDTYLDAFDREQINEVLHPAFNLHTVLTFRSSSQDPNFQNIPKRDTYSMKTIRKAIFPRKGNQLMELDYSGIEVGIAACYHKDPNMINYITDPSTDMHGDMAEQIYKIDDWDRERGDHATLRASAKNGFVFPQFYGDYFKMNAVNMCSNWMHLPQTKWKASDGFMLENGKTIGAHLISKGIKSFEDFVEHIKVIEKDFWKVRFPVYGKWKIDHYKQYQKKGSIALKTGFTCKGVMSKNACSNYPVQGAAFHCLLWCFTELSKALEEKGMDTRLVGQIHDAVVLDVAPSELHAVYELTQQLGTKDLLNAFPWINVPLSIDAELCPVDGSWAEKKNWHPEDAPETILEPVIKETAPMNGTRTNTIHYYSKNGIPWSSMYVGITGEGIKPLSKKRALKLAERLSKEVSQEGFIQQDLPF